MTGIKKELVLAAYRAILRREPENDEVVKEAMDGYGSPELLLRGFLDSPEYRQGLDTTVIERRFPLDSESELEIDHQASSSDMTKRLARVHQSWHFLGETDPYYSVLTWERFRNSRDNIAREEFLETGKGDIQRLTHWLGRNRVPINPEWTCLEYGCGTGRVTSHLSKIFKHVFAYDISEPHLKLARENCYEALAEGRATFGQVTDLSALDELPEVDFVFTFIVLQHNPPPIIGLILKRLLDRLRPGGVAYFQIPTACRGYSFRVDQYLQEEVGVPRMETHILPQRHVFRIITDSGCLLLEVQPDNLIGALDYTSNTFLVQKSAPASA